MKSPEEIKVVLQCCIVLNERCAECPNNGDVNCVDNVLRDSLEYIEQLEKELAEAKELAECRLKRKNFYKKRDNEHLVQAIRLRLERDAIKRDLVYVANEAGACVTCKRWKGGYPQCELALEGKYCYEWRGICDENSKD